MRRSRKTTAAEDRLDGKHARALFGIVGEVEEIGGLAAKKRHAVRALREMLGGELACWVVDVDFGPDRRGMVTDAVSDGYPDWLTRRCIEQYVAFGSIADPAVAAMMKRQGPIVAGARRELCSDRTWDRDPFVNEVRRTAGLDDSVYAMRYTGRAGIAEGLCLTRGVGDTAFAAQDRVALELFVADCAWLFRPQLSGAVRERSELLPRRHRETLEGLLAGFSESDIARRQGRSVHTVHQYVKELYRAFGVRSRAELLAFCLRPSLDETTTQ